MFSAAALPPSSTDHSISKEAAWLSLEDARVIAEHSSPISYILIGKLTSSALSAFSPNETKLTMSDQAN